MCEHTRVQVLFKNGDDLRQDQLIIQMISLLDSLLKVSVVFAVLGFVAVVCCIVLCCMVLYLIVLMLCCVCCCGVVHGQKVNLDLQLTPYRVLATGPDSGFVEFVPNSHTLSSVLKKFDWVCMSCVFAIVLRCCCCPVRVVVFHSLLCFCVDFCRTSASSSHRTTQSLSKCKLHSTTSHAAWRVIASSRICLASAIGILIISCSPQTVSTLPLLSVLRSRLCCVIRWCCCLRSVVRCCLFGCAVVCCSSLCSSFDRVSIFPIIRRSFFPRGLRLLLRPGPESDAPAHALHSSNGRLHGGREQQAICVCLVFVCVYLRCDVLLRCGV